MEHMDLSEMRLEEINWADYLKLREDYDRLHDKYHTVKDLIRKYDPKDHYVTFQLLRETMGIYD